ncbi:bifunctional tRNA (adenosine(37)-N6)-threonylcarbamoyltransferase complex dimerization subunit type 1 TsaB/ribosomal protein alanine acetyltransferase RimI [Mycolicibacter sinensis]|uniref:Ribosomal-protein-alanine acetyltransferase n=1 Tax=Mycolicibacter sinensis (strain JDM601) TaxID=875328 RepID=A0A1A3TM95_MYCSD|nr:bifunctional tRNA (adenosine(37)-N6)-threonylcarbamoyltransferase complex dimerization subunit type 1 TsaB/ribosomal protein alanine acetyltransferase RimI [Mycolicibacter sinensis]OBK83795.1 ribosomal-protein-alanine acetyltransferase [Mycolicibacter sinensis]
MTGTILTIDTATPAVTAGVVALDETDRRTVLAERVTLDARAHAERLTPNVLAALVDAGLSMTDLAAVVVGCGPGPFTGLRVGMASAAAYGHALGIPVLGVCSLDAIGVCTTGAALVVTDARRREVYWARYRDGIRVAGPAVSAPAAVDPGDALAVAGSQAHAGLFDLPTLDVSYPTPAGLVAAVRDWDADPAPLVPLYLRRPDAKPAASTTPLVTLGPLVESDAPRCAELEAKLFGGDDPWPAAAFRRAISARDHHYVAARIGDTLVGYAGISRLGRTPPFEFEVHTIGVDPGHQGRGIGRTLLADLLAYADGGVVHLEVRTDNAAAIALYRDVGFVETGLRRRYYRNGADAYMMRREACP